MLYRCGHRAECILQTRQFYSCMFIVILLSCFSYLAHLIKTIMPTRKTKGNPHIDLVKISTAKCTSRPHKPMHKLELTYMSPKCQLMTSCVSSPAEALQAFTIPNITMKDTNVSNVLYNHAFFQGADEVVRSSLL